MRNATDRSHQLSRDLDVAVTHALSILDRHERARARMTEQSATQRLATERLARKPFPPGDSLVGGSLSAGAREPVPAADSLVGRSVSEEALADLGDIHLPEGPTGGAAAATALEPLGPFYLAYELELAGLLRTAELLAGLFASGSITAPLGAAAKALAAFWEQRKNRLAQQERLELFQHVFEPPYFDRLFAAVMETIAQLSDHLQIPDWHEAALLEQSGEQLIEFLAPRAGGMVSFAAQDITNTINSALTFMHDPDLLRAFGAHNLWELVQYAAGENSGTTLTQLQQHVDLGKSGQTILSWIAESAHAGTLHLDPSTPGVGRLAAAAQTWLAAEGEMTVSPDTSTSLPTSLVPMPPVAPAPLVHPM